MNFIIPLWTFGFWKTCKRTALLVCRLYHFTPVRVYIGNETPGELSKVAAVVAKEHGNVIKLSHNQFVSINRSAAVELRITMESFGTEHKQEIISALEKEGYRPKVVQTNM